MRNYSSVNMLSFRIKKPVYYWSFDIILCHELTVSQLSLDGNISTLIKKQLINDIAGFVLARVNFYTSERDDRSSMALHRLLTVADVDAPQLLFDQMHCATRSGCWYKMRSIDWHLIYANLIIIGSQFWSVTSWMRCTQNRYCLTMTLVIQDHIWNSSSGVDANN